ncbi:MAG TPA: DUF4834 domain-containing protein [Cytophagales bacterium]|nr:DUF4834 domain-containing protein [Cytophagales bacterium]HRG09312.1 DUF4834 domain-containing protein [Cyclobacteriaceae bacterium]
MRFLIILGLIGYVLYKVGGLFFRAGAASQQSKFQPRRPQNGNVNVNSAPDRPAKSTKIKGGEYVDYEEVK